jgi:hypothetical protein
MQGIDTRLLDAFMAFDATCRSLGIRYSIDTNDDDYQAYLVKLGDSSKITESLKVSDWVNMNLTEDSEGTLFEFSIKTIGEDQYKAPTRNRIRKQSMWPSSFGRSRSYGGVSGYSGKLHKKISESLKLKDDLMAHDNITEIPKGTELSIHDPDPRLPDVDWDGKTTNVDKDKLGQAIDKKSEVEYKKTFKEGVLSEQASTVGAFLTSKIHEGYTLAADRAYAAGYMTQAERIALSEAISKALETFTGIMQDKYPNLYVRGIDSKDIMGMHNFRERIERRIAKL